MPEPMTQTGLRLPTRLLERVDEYADHVGVRFPGAKFSRSDAIRHLLTKSLAQEGFPVPLGAEE